MLRLIFLPLLLATLCTIGCMGQTFQYSRGWTNGKRSSYASVPGPLGIGVGPSSGIIATHFRRDTDDDIGLPELFEMQEAEHRMEKCLLQLQQYIRNPLQLRRGAAVFSSGYSRNNNNNNMNNNMNNNSNNNNNLNNNKNPNNNLFANHHQSNELLEDLSGGEPSDYLKH